MSRINEIEGNFSANKLWLEVCDDSTAYEGNGDKLEITRFLVCETEHLGKQIKLHNILKCAYRNGLQKTAVKHDRILLTIPFHCKNMKHVGYRII